MTRFTQLIIAGVALIASVAAGPAFAADVTHSTPGLSGYDPVAYFTDGKPVRGSGYHVAAHEGITYAFANANHKKLFIANPKQYLPAFGGYCAYGVAVGKKFVADPEVWKVVDGALYLNLDKGIQEKWQKDTRCHEEAQPDGMKRMHSRRLQPGPHSETTPRPLLAGASTSMAHRVQLILTSV